MTAYTSLDLVKSVRVRGMFPDASAGTFSAENILLLASEEIRLQVVPLILSAREKYYETFVEYPLTADQAIYPIPERAVGGVCSLVQYVNNQAVTNIPPLDPTSVATTQTGLYPRGFYFENDHIVIYPTPNATQGTIRIRYPQRTSLLVLPSECAQITAVDAVAETVEVTSYPSTWSAATKFDFVSNTVPYTPYGLETTCNTIVPGMSSTIISFTDLPKNREGLLQVKVGDWLAPAGYTCLPEIMSEFFPFLAQLTVVKLHEADNNNEAAGIAAKKMQDYAEAAIRLITPRETFGLKKVKSDWRNW
jgi:hypothetical protein